MFVPIITPSRKTPDHGGLAQMISNAIRAYRSEHPGVSASDVRRAFRAAENDVLSERSKGAQPERARLLAVAIGVLALLAGVGVFLYHESGDGTPIFTDGPPWIMVTLVVAIGIGAAAAAAARVRG